MVIPGLTRPRLTTDLTWADADVNRSARRIGSRFGLYRLTSTGHRGNLSPQHIAGDDPNANSKNANIRAGYA
jgi:hypothetical protein